MTASPTENARRRELRLARRKMQEENRDLLAQNVNLLAAAKHNAELIEHLSDRCRLLEELNLRDANEFLLAECTRLRLALARAKRGEACTAAR